MIWLREFLKNLKKFYYLHILRKKYYRTGKCLGCGQCCEKIYVKHGKGVIKSAEEFNRLKFMHSFYHDLVIVGSDETGLVFCCKNLDKQTRKCTIHSSRAKICRDYPQEEIFIMGGQLGKECGYKFTPIVPFDEVFNKILSKHKP